MMAWKAQQSEFEVAGYPVCGQEAGSTNAHVEPTSLYLDQGLTLWNGASHH